ncbi:MAG: hypothetical protein A3H42_01740 [Deltaproteobacteria bacterium RIFCSPLOWO2_02_FULL_46_8]|nr:MAG: hypothetical protein A3H42_01740 [Deltaproteobacteria bacterium RIFCSPLOWO2_02_FULL_46_8]
MKLRVVRIVRELIHHLPYSMVGVAASLGFLLAMEKGGWNSHPLGYFHITHPVHIFLSAIVTTAMFWKYEKQFWKAVVVGLLGVIPICSLSDVVLPYLGGILLKTPVVFHLCLVEEPWLVFPACFLGIFSGMIFLKHVEKLTELGHLSHVLISSLASLLYLISFDITLWSGSLSIVFAITLLAVWIPCCLSDIVFPLLFVPEGAGHTPCCNHHPHDY